MNLEEEENRMMARPERAAAPAAPMPPDAPCLNEMPFRQKVLQQPATVPLSGIQRQMPANSLVSALYLHPQGGRVGTNQAVQLVRWLAHDVQIHI